MRREATAPPFVVSENVRSIAAIMNMAAFRPRSAETSVLPLLIKPDSIELLPIGTMVPVQGRVPPGFGEGHDKLKDLHIKTLVTASEVDGFKVDMNWVGRYTHPQEIREALWSAAPSDASISGKEVFIHSYEDISSMEQLCKFPVMPFAAHPDIGTFWGALANSLMQHAGWDSFGAPTHQDAIEVYRTLSTTHDRSYVMRYMEENYDINSMRDMELLLELEERGKLICKGDPLKLAERFGDRVVQLVRTILNNAHQASGVELERFHEYSQEALFGSMIWVAYGESDGEMAFADKEIENQMDEQWQNFSWVVGVRQAVINEYGLTHIDSESVESALSKMKSAIKKLVKWAESK